MVVRIRKKKQQRSEKVDKWLDRRAAKMHVRLEQRVAKRKRLPGWPSLETVWPAGNG